MHQHIHGFDETPIVATSLGPRCAIAMSTAIIRLPIDHSDPRPSRNVSRTAVSNRGPHIRDYFQKTESTWNGETDVHLYTMSALAPKADIRTQSWNVRFVPKADSCIAFIQSTRRHE